MMVNLDTSKRLMEHIEQSVKDTLNPVQITLPLQVLYDLVIEYKEMQRFIEEVLGNDKNFIDVNENDIVSSEFIEFPTS